MLTGTWLIYLVHNLDSVTQIFLTTKVDLFRAVRRCQTQPLFSCVEMLYYPIPIDAFLRSCEDDSRIILSVNANHWLLRASYLLTIRTKPLGGRARVHITPQVAITLWNEGDPSRSLGFGFKLLEIGENLFKFKLCILQAWAQFQRAVLM